MFKKSFYAGCILLFLSGAVSAQKTDAGLANGSWEAGNLKPWKVEMGKAQLTDMNVQDGKACLQLASASGVVQTLQLQPKSRYTLTAWLRCGSGAEEVQMRLKKDKYVLTSVASPLADWVEKTIVFQTGTDATRYSVEFVKPFSETGAGAWIDNVRLVRTGEALAEVRRGIPRLPQRKPVMDLGLMQQSNGKMNWLLDAKLGLFIHWGLYSGIGRGEWAMRNLAIPIETYRQYAYPQSGSQQFVADQFNADEWAALAKASGMRYMCLTTQHHDGYALFHSRFPDIFCSYQTHNRDFIKEYTEACRKAGLRVGLYKTLINWRYPGYYDPSGTDCQSNAWGYKTAAWHKDNARMMKNEIYCLTKELMSNYGKVDLLFWDGGWLSEKGTDADAAYFWEPGKFLHRDNQWKVNPCYTLTDSLSGRQLGLMGMVRHLQPDILCNIRSGWIGDFDNEEGGGMITGPVRTTAVVEKCLSLHGAWGYTPNAENKAKIMSLAALKKMFADCLIRNMVLSINVGPDRHGHIPNAESDLLKEFGKWVDSFKEAVYGTRGGPWNPEDNEFGFTYKGNTIYVYLLEGYKGGNSFVFPAVETHKIKQVYEVATRTPLKWKKQKSGESLIYGIPRKGKDITVIAVQMNKTIY